MNMKKLLQMKFMLLLCALIVGSGTMWADDELYYTLDGTITTGGNSNYAQDGGGLTQGEIDWSVTGNTTINPWRIGGKNLTGQNREAYSKTAMGSAITKVELEIGSITLTVNSIKFIVASDADFGTILDEQTISTVTANQTYTFVPTSGSEWTTGAYYKFVFNVTAGGSNSYIQLKSAKFYKAGATFSPLDHITLSGDNYPTTFYVGDTFSHEGMTVTATYVNETTKDVTTGATFSGYDMSTAGVQTVTVSYTQGEGDNAITKSATYNITVKGLSSVRLDGTYPVSFTEGDAFSHEGMTVYAVYTDGTNESEEDVTSDAVFSEPDMTIVGNQNVTVSYTKNNVTKSTEYEITINALPTHNVTWSVNGTVTEPVSYKEGAAITFPANPTDIDGKSFVGWVTDAIVGTTETAPEFVTSATMGEADITYYAVFAEKTETTGDVTKAYGFETESDSDWTIDGPARTEGEANTGNYSGKINTNNTYVTFNNKVKVKEFSFAFKKTSNNNNYNVYIETSTDNTSWTAAATYPMSDFSTDYSTKTKTFEGNTEMYVRFHCSNTTAVRYVDDVTIKYDGTTISYSGYCTTVAADTREEADLSYSEGEVEIELKNESYNAVSDNSNPLNNPYNLNLTWSSSDETVATVNENGIVTLKAVGTTTITASFAGNDAYKPGSASFTLQVVDNRQTATVTWKDADGNNITELNVEKGDFIQGITLSCNVEGFTFTEEHLQHLWGTNETHDNYDGLQPAGYIFTPNAVWTAALGITTITATFPGDETYKPASATLTINVTEVPATYTLAYSITPGRHYIIASGTDENVYAMGGQNNNNRKAEEVTANNGVITVTNNVAEFLIEVDDKGYFTIKDEDTNNTGYLYAASNSSNQLKTQTENNNKGEWKIEIDGNGVATIKANKTGGHNWMRYNSTSDCFSCYDSEQNNIYLFEKDGDEGTQEFTVSIADACTDGEGKYYGTFSAPFACTVPSDVTVSEIAVVNGVMAIESYEAGVVIPANTGVMISSETPGTKTFTSAKGGTSVLDAENCLRPTFWGITADEMDAADESCVFYRLTMHNGTTIGFWWGNDGGNSFDIAANKAYMAVPAGQAAREGFAFDDDSTTGISNVNVNENVNGSIFDLQGRKVSTPGKGLYIVNGKKVVIKYERDERSLTGGQTLCEGASIELKIK